MHSNIFSYNCVYLIITNVTHNNLTHIRNHFSLGLKERQNKRVIKFKNPLNREYKNEQNEYRM